MFTASMVFSPQPLYFSRLLPPSIPTEMLLNFMKELTTFMIITFIQKSNFYVISFPLLHVPNELFGVIYIKCFIPTASYKTMLGLM